MFKNQNPFPLKVSFQKIWLNKHLFHLSLNLYSTVSTCSCCTAFFVSSKVQFLFWENITFASKVVDFSWWVGDLSWNKKLCSLFRNQNRFSIRIFLYSIIFPLLLQTDQICCLTIERKKKRVCVREKERKKVRKKAREKHTKFKR